MERLKKYSNNDKSSSWHLLHCIILLKWLENDAYLGPIEVCLPSLPALEIDLLYEALVYAPSFHLPLQLQQESDKQQQH